jgi:ATP-dependent exoDNAse (exonuclease V) alpha subunit
MAASRIATLATRPTKPGHEDPVRMHERWAQQARELGFGRVQLLDLLAAHPTGRDLTEPNDVVSERGNIAQDLAQHVAQHRCPTGELDELTSHRTIRELLGPDGLTAQTSTFRRRDVVREISDRLPHGAPAETILQLTEQVLHSSEVVTLTGLEITSGTTVSRFDERLVFTTRDLLRVEERVVALADQGRRAGRGLVEAGTVAGIVHGAPGLASEQRLMINQLCRSGNLIDAVVGVPGAGKTRSLAVAREAWQQAGHPVLGASVKATAAAELQTGAAIPSATVARLLLDLDRPDPRTGQPAGLSPGTVLVVDEAGMIGTRHLARLLAHVQKARGKLVLVGDPKQLPSIDAAGLFPLLAGRRDAIHLTSNHRQSDAEDRLALNAYRGKDIGSVLASYAGRGRLHTHPDAITQRQAIVDGWWSDLENGVESVMLAYRRIDIAALNRLAQIRMRGHGHLSGPAMHINSEELGERCFYTDDKVLLRRNDYSLGVRNGDRGTIRHIDHAHGMITVRLERDETITALPQRYLASGGLDHGYALTLHASQGLTITRTHVLANDALFYEAGLVALSRHRETCHLYVAGSLELDDDRERSHAPATKRFEPADQADSTSNLARALLATRADRAAVDHLTESRERDEPSRQRYGR